MLEAGLGRPASQRGHRPTFNTQAQLKTWSGGGREFQWWGRMEAAMPGSRVTQCSLVLPSGWQGTNLLWEVPLFSKKDPRRVHPHPQERIGDPFF